MLHQIERTCSRTNWYSFWFLAAHFFHLLWSRTLSSMPTGAHCCSRFASEFDLFSHKRNIRSLFSNWWMCYDLSFTSFSYEFFHYYSGYHSDWRSEDHILIIKFKANEFEIFSIIIHDSSSRSILDSTHFPLFLPLSYQITFKWRTCHKIRGADISLWISRISHVHKESTI